MSGNNDAYWAGVLMVAGVFAAAFARWASAAYVLTRLCAWHLSALVQTPTFVQALAIMLVVGLAKGTHSPDMSASDDLAEPMRKMTASLLLPWVTLGLGWLLT